MRRTLSMRAEPTVRQTEAILARISEALTFLGAKAARPAYGKLSFRMPAPWRARHLGILLAISSGTVTVSAGAGGPRQVRYHVSFLGLQILVGVISLALIALGWQWPRLDLFGVLVAVWVVLYGLPFAVAGRLFRRLVAASAREIVERRRAPRPPVPGTTPAPPPQRAPQAAAAPPDSSEGGQGA